MATYRKADDESVELLRDVMVAYHPRLAEAGVRVEFLEAFAPRGKNGEPKGPALKHHGYPALAVVKPTSHKDRVAGEADAILSIDGDRWPELTDARKRALLDHELTHLELVVREGEIQLDDCHRPKLKTRPHDFEVGILDDVIRRHGADSFDADALIEFGARLGRLNGKGA